MLLAIELADSLDVLADWWAEHRPALRALPAAELAQAVAAKDARKAALAPTAAPPPDPPRDPGIPPPSVVLPPLRRVPGYDGRRLL